jgi:hypothetical protein
VTKIATTIPKLSPTWESSLNIFLRILELGVHKPQTVVSVTEVNLARVPRALEGEVEGVVASRERVSGGCGVKVAVRG